MWSQKKPECRIIAVTEGLWHTQCTFSGRPRTLAPRFTDSAERRTVGLSTVQRGPIHTLAGLVRASCGLGAAGGHELEVAGRERLQREHALRISMPRNEG